MKSIKISATFLAALLVAGTIALSSPSFMLGAQADPYYGMDKENKKVDKKISVSSLKCNNINVNVNGLTLDVFPPFLGGGDIAADAVEPSTDASSFTGSGGNDKSEFNDFRFICINNNNNTVIGGEEPIPPTPPVDPCEDCFAQNLNATAFADVEEALATGINISIETGGLPAIFSVESFTELCDLIEERPLEISSIVQQVLEAAGLEPGEEFNGILSAIVDCIATALDLDIHG